MIPQSTNNFQSFQTLEKMFSNNFSNMPMPAHRFMLIENTQLQVKVLTIIDTETNLFIYVSKNIFKHTANTANNSIPQTNSKIIDVRGPDYVCREIMAHDVNSTTLDLLDTSDLKEMVRALKEQADEVIQT